MRFDYEGKKYYIQFGRHHVTAPVYKHGALEGVRSKFPSTTASLIEVDPTDGSRKVLGSYTVGCLPTDKFSLETGRTQALRGLTDESITNVALKVALWNSYLNRKG